MRRAKNLWDLRWKRWWGYNWNRKREEAIRKQRTQLRRQERIEKVNSFRKVDVIDSENSVKEETCPTDLKSTDGEKENSCSESEHVYKRSSRPVRLFRRVHRKYINSSARIQILYLTKLTKAFFQKHLKLRRRRKYVVENLIDLESSFSQDLTPPLFPVCDDQVLEEMKANLEIITSKSYDHLHDEYQTEMIELRNKSQSFSQNPLERFSFDVRSNEFKTSYQNVKRQTSDSSLKSMEYLAKRLEHLQKLDDWSEINSYGGQVIVKDQLKRSHSSILTTQKSYNNENNYQGVASSSNAYQAFSENNTTFLTPSSNIRFKPHLDERSLIPVTQYQPITAYLLKTVTDAPPTKPTKLVSFQSNNTRIDDMRGKIPAEITPSDVEKNWHVASTSENNISFSKYTFDDTKSKTPTDSLPITSPIKSTHPLTPKLSPIKVTVNKNNPPNEHLRHQIEKFKEYSSAPAKQNDLNLSKNVGMKLKPSSSSLYLDSFSYRSTPHVNPQYYNKYHHLFHQSPYLGSHVSLNRACDKIQDEYLHNFNHDAPTWTSSVSTQTQDRTNPMTTNTTTNTRSVLNRSISTQTVETQSSSSIQQAPECVSRPISELESSPQVFTSDRTTSTHFWADSGTQTNSCTRLKHHRWFPNANVSDSVSRLLATRYSNYKETKNSEEPSRSECNLFSDRLSYTNIPERLESVSVDIIFDKNNVNPQRAKSHSGVRLNIRSDFPNKVLPRVTFSDIPDFETLPEPALKSAIYIVNNEIIKPGDETVDNGNNAALPDGAILSEEKFQSLENLDSVPVDKDKAKITKKSGNKGSGKKRWFK